MPRDARTILYPLAALLVVGGLLYLRPERTAPPPPDVAPQEAGATPVAAGPHAFTFLRAVDLPQPIDPVLRAGPVDDRVTRWFERVKWSPIQQVDYALEQLASLRDPRDVDRFVALTADLWRTQPQVAARYLPALGVVRSAAGEQGAACEALILEAALNSSALVRSQAVRALASLDSDSAAARAEQLLDDPNESVRRSAVRGLIEMKNPEGLAVLRRYAAKNAEEGLKEVLFRLGQDLDDPSGIPQLREHLEDSGPPQMIALRMLARFGDGNAIDLLGRRLRQGDAFEKYTALTFLSDAPADALDAALLVQLADDPNHDIRRLALEQLLRMGRAGAVHDKEAVAAVFARRADDSDMRVRQIATAGLWSIGRKEVAEPYLKALATASGEVLHNAIDLTTRLFVDERALPTMLQRFQAEPAPSVDDQAQLVVGFGNLADPRSLDVFLAILRRAGPNEPVDAIGWPLSKRAALHMTTLGMPIQAPLLALLADRSLDDQAHLRALDVLRGLEGVNCAAELVGIAEDDSYPLAVRKAAIESLPYLKGVDIYAPLSGALDDLDSAELRRSAMMVLLDYA